MMVFANHELMNVNCACVISRVFQYISGTNEGIMSQHWLKLLGSGFSYWVLASGNQAWQWKIHHV